MPNRREPRRKSYTVELDENLKTLTRRLRSVEDRLLLTNTSSPEFWDLVSERNNLTVSVATAKDRIENLGKHVQMQYTYEFLTTK